MIDLIIRNGNIVTHNNERLADIAIKNGKIFKIGKLPNLKSKKTIDARDLHVLPGAFDTQVHFREPGNTKKENLKTGSLAAVAGGITSVFDMPNNNQALQQKSFL
jgi:dihydroorotase